MWKSFDLTPPQLPPRPPQRSCSLSGQSAPLSEPKVHRFTHFNLILYFRHSNLHFCPKIRR